MIDRDIVRQIMNDAPEGAIDFMGNIVATTLMFYDRMLSEDKKREYGSFETFLGEMLISFMKEVAEVLEDEE